MKLESTNISNESAITPISKNWNDCIYQFLEISHLHILPNDWYALPDSTKPNCKALWKSVPVEDLENYHQMIIDQGRSYAYVSLLHLCARQNIRNIKFSKNAPIITNLNAFEDEWANHIPTRY